MLKLHPASGATALGSVRTATHSFNRIMATISRIKQFGQLSDYCARPASELAKFLGFLLALTLPLIHPGLPGNAS
jgi:hypothetical protein